MAIDFEVIKWEDSNGDRHDGKPTDISETYGELVHVYDDVRNVHSYFWAYVYDSFDEWEEWLDYIEILIDSNTSNVLGD